MSLKRYVEIGVVLAILIFIFSVTAYSGEIPPVSTIASESMTHSDYWTYGTLNVGDIVFVKKIDKIPVRETHIIYEDIVSRNLHPTLIVESLNNRK